jgi:DNA-binding protein HU-beta
LVEAIMEAVVAGEKVTLVGFGSFERRERSAREGRNPQTGETLQIAATKVPAFSAGKLFKERVAG